MPKARKLRGELRDRAAELLKTKTRAEVCKELGVDYFMLRREFGNAWTHAPKQVVEESAS